MSNGEAAMMIGFRWASALGLGLALVACSARVGVGFEPAGEGGDANGSSSSGGSGSTQSGHAGALATGATGEVPSERPICDYGSTRVGTDERPLLTSAEVLARIYQFLDGDPSIPAGALPPAPTPSWAAARAKGILDGHAAAGTPAPGLERFLGNWLLRGQTPREAFESPAKFARKLVEPDATLSTLLAEPTGEHRIGILTEPEFLSHYATITTRGMWMSRHLLCREIPAPPEDVLEETLGEGETRRERLENGSSQPVCQGCHQLMDPPGYSLEHYDGAGDYSELDNGHPVNAAGTLMDPPVSFSDFSELAPQLASSCTVGHCFTRLLANDAFGAPLQTTTLPLSEQELNRAALSFAESGYSIRALVDSIVRSPSFLR
jgi:hypothetical protein